MKIIEIRLKWEQMIWLEMANVRTGRRHKARDHFSNPYGQACEYCEHVKKQQINTVTCVMSAVLKLDVMLDAKALFFHPLHSCHKC